MSFELNEEQKMIRAMVREFARTEILPRRRSATGQKSSPGKTCEKWANWPHGHECAGRVQRRRRRHRELLRGLQEIAYACAATA